MMAIMLVTRTPGRMLAAPCIFCLIPYINEDVIILILWMRILRDREGNYLVRVNQG